MSRSRKKPYFTDSNPGAKQAANRAVRRANKRQKPEQTPVSGKAYRKEFNSWDIRDWAFYSPENKKAHRK